MSVSAAGLTIFLLISTNLGLPIGIPPAPEDPLMARVVPEDVLVLASWAGTAPLDPEANPTQKWMAHKENQLFLKKLTDELKSFGKQQEKFG